jgi:lysophospholipid acyltransferase (LPLAT)-like uncharacterized protein
MFLIMGRLTKIVTRTAFVQRLLALAAAALIALVRATTRWTAVNEAAAQTAWAGERPVIVAFWHNRLAMMPTCWRSRKPFQMLISSHPDGQLIAATVAHFGIGTIAGSSRRGGSEALRGLVQSLRAGISVGITPDGPRGPRMHATDGALALARLSGAAILPASVSVSRRLVLDTWDKLIIALPFARGAMVWGDAIAVPREAEGAALETLRAKLETELNRVSALADEMTGHAAMAPAPLTQSADARA